MAKHYKILLTFLSIMLATTTYSQTNLVPNPSFEIHDTCPHTDNIALALGWYPVSNDLPNYFNACAPSPYYFSVPDNIGGYSYAASGNAYAGIVVYEEGSPSTLGEFYCGLVKNIFTGAIPNYVYRIIGDVSFGTPPNEGDIEFFGSTKGKIHNVLVDHYIGVGAAPSNYNPQNRIHITTAGGDPYFGNIVAGSSGLRFTNLTATNTTGLLANPGPGVLAVDGNAQILFYDVLGKQINNVVITTRGAGQLNVYANDLTNGVYSYTLIVDGQIVDTKKMVKQQ